MKVFHHLLEFKPQLFGMLSARILGMRREEIQRHIAPVVAFLRVALKNRHQLDNRHSEFLEIRDLFYETGVGAGARWVDAGVGILGEAFHVKFVDDSIGLMIRRPISRPVECQSVIDQHSQRRAASIGPFPHRQVPVKAVREENALRVWIKENLLGVKTVEFRKALARDGVGVKASRGNLRDGDAAMPDSPRLVTQEIQLDPQKRVHQIGWRVHQKSDAVRVFRVNGKVKRLFSFDPSNAEG